MACIGLPQRKSQAHFVVPKTRTNLSFGCARKLTEPSEGICACEAESVAQGRGRQRYPIVGGQWPWSTICLWESCPKAKVNLWFAELVSSRMMAYDEGGVQAVMSLLIAESQPWPCCLAQL